MTHLHMAIAIDRGPYALAPRVSMNSGTTLIEQLIDVAKDDPSPTIEGSAKKLRKVVSHARSVRVEDVRATATATAAGDLELDLAADRRSKAVKLRLEAWLLLDEDAKAERARQLLALLYPQGLRFTKATFGVQDAEMRRMLTEMKDPESAASLEELVGAPFVKGFKKTAKAYSEMVKAMGRAVPTEVDQRSVIIAMQTAIVQHASRVLGELEDDDPASVERVRGLLAPIDNFRARTGNGGAAAAGGSTGWDEGGVNDGGEDEDEEDET